MSMLHLKLDTKNNLQPLNSHGINSHTLSLFYGTSTNDPEALLDCYVNKIKDGGARVYDINDMHDYAKCFVRPGDYLRIRSDCSSSIHDESSAHIAASILLCGDNVLASIHALNSEQAFKRFKTLMELGFALNAEV
ncbi:hypothetical protein PO360_21800 [Enterobacter ludwigii]|uniref:hypothetical protein n=1 Tax=Enterobacter cloacae complex TaxID=354276 RepID=UPI002FF6F087